MSLVAIVVLGLLILVLVGGGIRMFSGLGSISVGHADLACPSCGKNTPANRHVCEHCGDELR